jgi:CDP-paratose 2-epimerase
MIEAINLCEEIAGKKLDYTYVDENRIGDHMWWISDLSKFKSHCPKWEFKYGLEDILHEIYENSAFTKIET